MGLAVPLFDFLELQLELRLFLLFFSGCSSFCNASISLMVVNDIISASRMLVCGGDLHGLAMGVQSDSLSSKTSGNKSSSEMKPVGSSVLPPLSDVLRGHDGYAHDGL